MDLFMTLIIVTEKVKWRYDVSVSSLTCCDANLCRLRWPSLCPSCRKLWSSVSAGKDIRQDCPDFYFERLFSLASEWFHKTCNFKHWRMRCSWKKIEVCCFCLLYLFVFFCVSFIGIHLHPGSHVCSREKGKNNLIQWENQKKTPIKSAESWMKFAFIPFAGDCHTRLCLRPGLPEMWHISAEGRCRAPSTSWIPSTSLQFLTWSFPAKLKKVGLL